MSEKKEEYYLDINGVISFKEFVVSMRKGSLKNQISSILDKQFPEAEALGPIMIESVKVVVQDDCIKILPQFNRVIENEMNSDKEEYDKTAIVPTVEARPPSPVPRTSSKPSTRSKVKFEKSGHVVNELKSKLAHAMPPKAKLAGYRMPKAKSRQSESKEQKEIRDEINHVAKIRSNRNYSEMNETKNEIKSLQLKLNGNVNGIKNIFQSQQPKRIRIKKSDKKQPAESAGYIWQRDYDSTDDENIWDRIGSLFGSERGSSSRSNNHSVSSGDYCEHAMHTNCV